MRIPVTLYAARYGSGAGDAHAIELGRGPTEAHTDALVRTLRTAIAVAVRDDGFALARAAQLYAEPVADEIEAENPSIAAAAGYTIDYERYPLPDPEPVEDPAPTTDEGEEAP